MIDSPTYRMADALAGGDLASILRQMRGQRKSFVKMAGELWASHGIDVSAMTLKNWCDALDIESPDAKAAG